MVDTEVAGAGTARRTPVAPHHRGRRWWLVWVAAPVAFLLLLLVARIVYWRTSVDYAPFRVGAAVASVPGQPSHLAAAPAPHRIAGPVGTEQLVEVQLVNHGNHAVDIRKVEFTDPAVDSIGWAAVFVEDGRRQPSPSHAFPAHVPRQATVGIRFLLRKPACPSGAVRSFSARVTIHWHAMMDSHVTTLDLLAGRPPFLTLCGP